MHVLWTLFTAAAVSLPTGGQMCDPSWFLGHHPDYFQYRVGILRRHWNTEYLLTTIWTDRDTLCRDQTISSVARLIPSWDFPDTTMVTMRTSVVRFEHRGNGTPRSPRRVDCVGVPRLRELEKRSHGQPPPPPPLEVQSVAR